MSNKDFLKIEHINAQSLLAHRDELVTLVHERNTDIVICISETWLLPHTPDAPHVDITDFTIFRHDKGLGGGVCLYVRDYLTVSLIETAINKPEGIEDTWVSDWMHSYIATLKNPREPFTTFLMFLDLFVLKINIFMF